jgi:membrane protease YdiL (CAAX protease family)
MRELSPRSYRGPTLVLVAAVGVVLYGGLTLTVSGLSSSIASAEGKALLTHLPLLESLPGDLPSYALRFLLSLLCLGALPFLVTLLSGERAASLGLRWPLRGTLRALPFLVLLGLALVAGAVAAYIPDQYAYYPFSKTLLDLVLAGRTWLFPLHAGLYLLFYYLPWELLFRGVLVLVLLRAAGLSVPAEGQRGRLLQILRQPPLLLLVFLQAIPSAVLHLGHPVSEALWAIPFGAALGVLALWTESILPGLAIHAVIGISLDLFILLRYAGILP